MNIIQSSLIELKKGYDNLLPVYYKAAGEDHFLKKPLINSLSPTLSPDYVYTVHGRCILCLLIQ